MSKFHDFMTLLHNDYLGLYKPFGKVKTNQINWKNVILVELSLYFLEN